MLASAQLLAASRATPSRSCLKAARSCLKAARETLRRRKPSLSVSEGSALSPCRFASTRAALPLAAAAAPGGEAGRGSICHSEHRAPLAAREADLTGAGRGSTRTASGASTAVASRARLACVCAVFLFVERLADLTLMFLEGIVLTTTRCPRFRQSRYECPRPIS